MKRQGRELPEERVLLYEAYVKSLLTDWHRVRSLSRTSIERPSALAPDPHARAPERVLEDVGLWMQETAPGKGLVAEPTLRRRLTGIFADTPDCEARCADFTSRYRPDQAPHGARSGVAQVAEGRLVETGGLDTQDGKGA